MKKSIKLPLFLGSVALICTAALAVVNEVTKDQIAKNYKDKADRGFLTVLGLKNSDGFILESYEVAEHLSKAGVNEIKTLKQVSDESLAGVAYDMTVKGGFAGDIQFQVGFKGDVYSGFNVVKSSETPGYGEDYLKELTKYFVNVPISTTSAEILAATIKLKPGTTVTRGPVLKGIEVLVNDYQNFGKQPQTLDPNYLGAFGLSDGVGYSLLSVEVSEELSSDVSEIKALINSEDKELGLAYEVNVKGYAGNVQYFVGFIGEQYAGFVVGEHGETAGFGKAGLDNLAAFLPDKPISTTMAEIRAGSFELAPGYASLGVSMTATPVMEALEKVVVHYETYLLEKEISALFGLSELGDHEVNEVSVTEELTTAGITKIYELSLNDEVVGLGYYVQVTGYNSKVKINFSVGLVGDKYATFIVGEHGETAGFGKAGLDNLATFLPNKPISTTMAEIRAGSFELAPGYATQGVSMTATPVMRALEKVVVHYETYLLEKEISALFGLSELGDHEVNEVSVTEELTTAGITKIYELSLNDEVVGLGYYVQVTGYNSKVKINFSVGLVGDKYATFIVGEHGETAGFGKAGLDNLATFLPNKPISTTMAEIRAGSFELAPGYATQGVSMTATPVMSALEQIVAAYVAATME